MRAALIGLYKLIFNGREWLAFPLFAIGLSAALAGGAAWTNFLAQQREADREKAYRNAYDARQERLHPDTNPGAAWTRYQALEQAWYPSRNPNSTTKPR